MTKDPVTRGEEKVAWWTEQSDQLERHRRQLNFVPLVGAGVAVGAAFVHPLVAGIVAAVTAATWLMGIYMTTVRATEFDANVRDAQQELREARERAVGPTAPPS